MSKSNNIKQIKNIKNKNKKVEEEFDVFDYTLEFDNGLDMKISRKEYESQMFKLAQIEKAKKDEFHVKKSKKISKKKLSQSIDRLFQNKKKIYCSMTPSVDEGQCFRSSLDDIILTNGFISDCEEYFVSTIKPYTLQMDFTSLKEQIQTKVADLNNQDLMKLLEDILIFIKMLVEGKSKKEHAMAIFIFAKLRMGDKPIINSDFFSNLVKYFTEINTEMQADGFDLPECFTSLRELLSKYSSIKTSPFIKKIYRFSMYALSLSLFSKIGITLDNMNYTKMEVAAIKSQYHLGPDFIHCLLDTLLFISERGYQCLKTGTMSPLFHSDRTYGEWFDAAQKLKDQARFSHNFSLGNVCEFKFRAELDDIIEKGESIAKFAFEMDNVEKSLVRKFVNELWMIKVDLMTKKAAKESRTPPFSVLISGDSSIGKSSIMEMIFTHFGKRQNMPIDCEYKYTRNAAAKFWDGFTTSQWCIIFDDIAFMHPNKAPQGDPTLMEIIQLINAVPFTPDQASLNDKGNTPVRAKLVVASTNTEDLNAHYYFACPSAVQRRFPFIIEPIVLPQYMADDGKTLDSSKCVQTGEYPDYWRFNVKKVLATPKDPSSGKHYSASMRSILESADLKTFLKWLNTAIIEHDRNQDCVKTSLQQISNAVLCTRCGLPESLCDCTIEFQAHVHPFTSFMMGYFCSNFCVWFVESFVGFYYLSGFFSNSVMGRYLYAYIYNRVSIRNQTYMQRMAFKALGKAIHTALRTPPLLVYITVYLTSLYAINSLRIMLSKHIWGVDSEAESSEIGVTPKDDTEKRENVWYKNVYDLSSFDYTPKQTSSKSCSIEDFAKRLHNNVVHLRMVSNDADRTYHTGAVCLKGNLYLLNKHAIPLDRVFELEVICQSAKDGVSKNVTMVAYSHNVLSLGNDLAAIEISCLPPGKDITEYFATKSFAGIWNGLLLTRSRDGCTSINYSKKISLKDANWIEDVKGKHWEYIPQTKTQKGDCGGLLIAETTTGHVIVGIHYAGISTSFQILMANQSAAVPVTCDLIKDLSIRFLNQFTAGVPALESETAEAVLVDLHHKSPIRFIEKGSCSVYGSLAGFRSAPKSTVCHSIMCDYMLKKGHVLKHTQPSMKGWEPKRKALVEIMSMDHKFDPSLLMSIADDWSASIIKELGDKLKILEVYDDFTAVNGAAGVTYVDKLNRNTSMGFPWRKSKKYHMTAIPPRGGNTDAVEMSAEVMKRVSDIISNYQESRMNHPIFTAALKDEPVTFAKAKEHATRVFMGAPVDWSIVVRKYYLSFIKLVQSNRTTFECGAGTIVQSDEWHNYRQWLTAFGENRIVAGDYSKFDKRMSAEIIKAAFHVMLNVMRASNMTEDEIKVAEGIAFDTAYPMVDYFGDLIQFNGCNPSGHPLTVIVNSLANSIYMRYCYYMLNPKHEIKTFQDLVHLMTYGDDNIMGVSENIPWFNHTTIANILNTYGVKYTMAEKEAESVPYIHINDASFLKRKWVFCKDMQRFLCPLDEDSIIKSLMIWIPSKTICAEQQSIAIMNSAVMEYFFYGKGIFEEKRNFFYQMVQDLSLNIYYEGNEFPTWEQLRDRYVLASKSLASSGGSGLNQTLPIQCSLLSDLFAEVSMQSRSVDIDESFPHERSSKSLFNEVQLEHTKITSFMHEQIEMHVLDKLSTQKNTMKAEKTAQKTLAETTEQNKTRRNLKHKNYVYVDLNDLPDSFTHCDNCDKTYITQIDCPRCNTVNTNILPNFTQHHSKTTRNHFKCELQSAEELVGTSDSKPNNDIQTLVQSVDAERGMVVSFESPMEQLSSHLFPSDAELKNFLTRPVLIKSYTWTEGGGLADSFYPWYEYLNHPIIKNKIQNYFTGRMNLHLKIMINASPFYYGAALVSYVPMPTGDTAKLNSGDSTYTFGLSQRPHVWVYPQTSQAGEMHLPFLYNYDAVNLTSIYDVRSIGQIDIKSATLLKNANSVSAGGCTLRIYAYASDIHLGGPTVKTVLQASDEYGKGPVSGVASAVANISKSLEKVPVIGRFAKATTIGASAVSTIAAMFGFTDVPVIEDVKPLKNLPYHSLTSAHIGEPVTKLCLDPKNEVTIDNSVMGVDTEDELVIANFVNRYSYIGSTTWSGSNAVDTLLWSGRVQPNYFILSNTAAGPNGNRGVLGTPVGHVAQLFQYWRGSITYKITTIASKFHRGRYVITWDPTGDVSAATSYVGTAFTKIVDIAEESEIEITIPYQQNYPFCRNQTYLDEQPFSTAYTPHVIGIDNGVITIRVFTQQTSPVATADIELLVSVKGGSDLEFALPRAISRKLSPFAFQSDVTMNSRTSMEITNEKCVADDTRYLVSFGESIKSLRTILRRGTLYSADILNLSMSTNYLTNYIGSRSVFPISPGFDPKGVHSAIKSGTPAGNAPYNFVNYTPVSFLTQCFAGWRGSIIHHLNMNSGTTADGFLASSFSPETRTSAQWNQSSTIGGAGTTSQLTSAALSFYNPGNSGTDMTSGYVMPCMSVSVPFNTPSKFCYTNPKFAVEGNIEDSSDLMTLQYQFTTRDATLAQIVDYVQIGTDFNVGFFVNVPLLYRCSTIPTGASA